MTPLIVAIVWIVIGLAVASVLGAAARGDVMGSCKLCGNVVKANQDHAVEDGAIVHVGCFDDYMDAET